MRRAFIVIICILLLTACSKSVEQTLEPTAAAIAPLPPDSCSTPETREVRGTSMLPLFFPGDNITILNGYYRCHAVSRGDIVVYDYIISPVPIIKSVRGVPGDSWSIRENMDGTFAILVNNETLKNSAGQPYAIPPSKSAMLRLYTKDYPVLPAEVFLLMGEDVQGSADATEFGLVGLPGLIGRVDPSGARRPGAPAAPKPKPTPAVVKLKGDRPNVLIITIDTLRAQQMGTYGYGKNTTPFLDELFAKGVVYENAITPAYLTFQSDAAMLTSTYPSQNNIQDWNTKIVNKEMMLPEILRYYGYSTAAFVSPSLWESFEMNDSFDEYTIAPDVKNIAYSKDNVTAYLRGQKGPFFVFWHTYDVHLPFHNASEEFHPGEYDGLFTLPRLRVENDLETGYGIIWENQTKQGIGVCGRRNVSEFERCWRYTFTDADKEYARASYDTGIKYTDAQLELFFKSIEDEPWYDNTIIIITSEHGEDLWEHGFMFHRDLYDVNTRVPLAIIYPAKLKPQRVDEPVSTLDLPPTVLGLIGIPAPADAEGVDLLASKNPRDRKIYTERPPFDEYSVRTARYKYILRNPAKGEHSPTRTTFMQKILAGDDIFTDELYDLENDPLEQNNLIGHGFPIEDELRADAVAFRERMRQARAGNTATTVDIPVFTYP